VQRIISVVVFFSIIAIIGLPSRPKASSMMTSQNQIEDKLYTLKWMIAQNQKQEMVPLKEKEEEDFFDQEEEEELFMVPDPIEGWNRMMYHFNDKLYFWILKPIAVGYRNLVPAVARTGIKNFLYNATAPVRFVNCLLQGKWKKAEAELSRFMICTSFGILGFGNPVKNYPELNPGAEDLGQTFASWGIKGGIYIVWPFFGPSTIRDSVGSAGDLFLDPTFLINRLDVSIAIWSVELVNNTSFRIGDYEAIKEASFDPYVAIRDAYLQNRKKKIEQ